MLGADKLSKLVENSLPTMEDESFPAAQVGTAMLIVEVRDIDSGVTAFYTFCTDKREWVQRALIREASDAIEFSETEVPDGE